MATKTKKRKTSITVRTAVYFWDQQPGESNPAFAAYRCYFELGDQRSLRAVEQKLGKSGSLISRWSSRWEWPERIKQQTKFILDRADEETARRLPDIMGEGETLARVSMLARADLGLLTNEQGEFDLVDIKKRGLSYMLGSVKSTTKTYDSGLVVATTEYKIEPRHKYLDLLGRHLGLLSGEVPDPEVLLLAYVEALKGQKHRLPPANS